MTTKHQAAVVTPLEPPPRQSTICQTVYLPGAVHEQLRVTAFHERVKMHAILMEGLDLAFKARGLPSIAKLTGKN
jgi:hypothetical protein